MSNNEGRKRETRVTIKDVAKAAGVSIATVSYVLNNKPGQSISEDTRKKVLQFANLLGYECNIMAKYLATGKTNTIAAVVKDIKPFAAHYYLKLLTELSRILQRRNYDLRLVDYHGGLQRGSDCDAYITLALDEAEFRTFADTKYVPVVAIDSMFEDFLFYRINDDFAALKASAAAEFATDDITLLSFELARESREFAESVFGKVKIINNLSDISDLDPAAHYATVSSYIRENAIDVAENIKLASASFALKASAAAEAAINAINRVNASHVEHNITI